MCLVLFSIFMLDKSLYLDLEIPCYLFLFPNLKTGAHQELNSLFYIGVGVNKMLAINVCSVFSRHQLPLFDNLTNDV